MRVEYIPFACGLLCYVKCFFKFQSDKYWQVSSALILFTFFILKRSHRVFLGIEGLPTGECSRWSVIAILLFYDIHYSVYNLLCLIICFTGLPYKLFFNNVKYIPHWEETLSPVGSHTFLARARVSCLGRWVERSGPGRENLDEFGRWADS